MIEKFLQQIIAEFGPVGVLLLGIFWIFGRHLGKICDHIETLNHNSTKLLEVVERCADRICDKIDGKN